MKGTSKPLTTGDCARMLHVAPRTVVKWIDGGKLAAYRLPSTPASKNGDRRVERPTLYAFMKKHGFPVPAELRPPAVLWCGGSPDEWKAEDVVLVRSDAPEDVGMAAEAYRPTAACVYAQAYGRAVALRLVQFLFNLNVRVAAVPTEDDAAELPWLERGAAEVVPFPGEPAAVRAAMDRLLQMERMDGT